MVSANDGSNIDGRRQGDRCEKDHLRLIVCYFVALGGISAIAAPDYMSVANSFLRKEIRHDSDDLRIDTETMRGMEYPADNDDTKDPADALTSVKFHQKMGVFTAHDYATGVNDGLKLLKEHVDRNSRVFCSTSSNPFPFALRLPSPKGAPPDSFWGNELTKKHHPAPERIFMDVTHLMIYRDPNPGVDSMSRIYGDYIQRHFSLVDKSDLWFLYVRKPE